ncbi:gliding motility-associated C-terminal domain-containing protein, partial [Flavobacterium sp. LS1R49]
GAILDPVTNCQSSVRLLVTVTVTDPATPTTLDTTQDFCLVNAPTVASLQVNETGVVWYTTATGGVALAPTTALASGSYYGAIHDPVTNCESSVRLLVTVTVTDPATPTTLDTTQDFCLVNAPTVASLQVNETGVVWYTTATGGVALAPTTALASGSYYGAILDPVTNCQSSVRLLVTVTVNDAGIPTTTTSNQTFCLSALPKISDLQVNEIGVVWYNAATGGTPLSLQTLLVAGAYYAALQNSITGCQSKSRLVVQVNFTSNDPVTITSSKAAPCVFDEITYTTASGMSSYNWTITGGGTITAGGLATDNFVTVSWPAIGPASVNVAYSNQCNEINSKLLALVVQTCSDITMTKTVDNPTPNINDKVTFTVTVNNVGSGNFINTIVSEIIPTGYNFISAQTSTGIYSNTTGEWNIPTLNATESATLTVVVQVLPTGNYLNVASILISDPIDSDILNNHAEAFVTPVCLVVYNEFTPNNDGANDVFKIDCIENYPNNSLNVYNRYGVLVYKQDHYNNDWDGTANVSGSINRGDKLPAGTYYYVLDIGADGGAKTGWLSIIR